MSLRWMLPYGPVPNGQPAESGEVRKYGNMAGQKKASLSSRLRISKGH